METILYLSVKTASVTFILYKVWNMIFSKRMENFWDMLHNWACARIRLWKCRKKRMAEKSKKIQNAKSAVAKGTACRDTISAESCINIRD